MMMSNVKQYAVGDQVEVRQPGATIVNGKVVEVVAPGKYPDGQFMGMFRKGRQLATRPFESYVVEIDGMKSKERFRWPKASWLSPPTTITSAALPAVPSSVKIIPAKTETEIQTKTETLPDGTVITTTTTIQKETPAKQARLLTEFIFVVDASGSMGLFQNRVVPAVLTKIQAIAQAANQTGLPQPKVSIILFESNTIDRVVNRVPADQVKNFRYYVLGGTNMYDAIGYGASAAQTDAAILEAAKSGDQVSFVLEVITDGEENQSTKFTAPILGTMFRERMATGDWTFAFQVPESRGSIFKKQLMAKFPMIPEGNILEWAQTDAGFKAVMDTATLAAANYSNSRGTYGTRSSSSYYVQPNLSTVTAQDLAKMVDLSHKFKVHTIAHEADIQPYIEGKTGSPYVIGSAYFQLTKKEKIGADKEVVIRDKASKRIYGGDEARQIVGLPAKSANIDCKIEPGNHANYDIFLESRSPNRKLVRGSILLHDVTMTVGKTPTFDVSVLQPKPVTP